MLILYWGAPLGVLGLVMQDVPYHVSINQVIYFHAVDEFSVVVNDHSVDMYIFVLRKIHISKVVKVNIHDRFGFSEFHLDEVAGIVIFKGTSLDDLLGLGVELLYALSGLLIGPEVGENHHWDLVVLESINYVSCLRLHALVFLGLLKKGFELLFLHIFLYIGNVSMLKEVAALLILYYIFSLLYLLILIIIIS